MLFGMSRRAASIVLTLRKDPPWRGGREREVSRRGWCCGRGLFAWQPKADRAKISPRNWIFLVPRCNCCLLYTSDAADEEDSVDLGGRRIIKKKKKKTKKK